MPTLRFLYAIQNKCPEVKAMKNVTVDEGAIKPVLTGANIMRPGICAFGDEDFECGEAVAVYAKGKVGVLAIGKSIKSKKEM